MRNPLRWLADKFTQTNPPTPPPSPPIGVGAPALARKYVAKGNYGWNFGVLSKRLKGKHKERWTQGRFNRFVRGLVDKAGNKARPPRYWTAPEWQRKCAAARGVRL